MQIWAPLEQESISKIKYAKYHALRIAKAIKAGEDPNASNPVPDSHPMAQSPAANAADLNVQLGDPPNRYGGRQPRSHQPSIEDVPDEDDRVQRFLAQRSVMDESIHPSRATSGQRHSEIGNSEGQQDVPSPQEPGEAYYQNAAAGDVSPMVSPDQTSPHNSGYFPIISDELNPVSTLPQAPPNAPSPASSIPQASHAPSASNPYDLPSNSPRAFIPPPAKPAPAPRDIASSQSYITQTTHASVAPSSIPMHSHPVQNRPQQPIAALESTVPPSVSQKTEFVADEEAILTAQKHARW